MLYKNTSYTNKTFYGVTFKPREIKEVDGIINNRWMIPISDSATKAPEVMQRKPSSEEASKEVAETEKVNPVEEPAKELEKSEEQLTKEDKTSRSKERKS